MSDLKQRITAILDECVYEWQMDQSDLSMGPELAVERIMEVVRSEKETHAKRTVVDGDPHGHVSVGPDAT